MARDRAGRSALGVDDSSPAAPAHLGPAPAELPAFWPEASHSHTVVLDGLRWHVQHWPAAATPPGRTALATTVWLLHGTGASSHSFAQLAPLLAATGIDCFAPDLPGHGFTTTPAAQPLTLPAVAQAVARLVQAVHSGAQRPAPALLLGHSAGAAVALQAVLAGELHVPQVLAINGALLPLQGPMGRLLLPLARLLVINPLVPGAFATWATAPGVAKRLLQSTGSALGSTGERCYAWLMRQTQHVHGALRLMASWDLAPLQAALSQHGQAPPCGLTLLVGQSDTTLPPSHAQRVRALWPSAQVHLGPGGHLLHEEAPPLPQRVVQEVLELLGPAAET
jgi:magnesium chelatase accessory protein